MAKQSCCGGSASVRTRKASFTTLTKSLRAGAAPCEDGCQSCGKPVSGQTCGCASALPQAYWITGQVDTPAGPVPRVSTRLLFPDILRSWKCRWAIGRMDYKVDPGLYCVGCPDDRSPVLVTANYKMTFDRVRASMDGTDAWILVLDTDGVNVWCAAGKGTFGTEELVCRIAAVGLDRVVSHRTVIVPQLGATGIAAQDVRKQSGFKVVFGPVRAGDLKAFFAAGMTATEAMRTVRFSLRDRIVLTPVELVTAVKPLVIALGILFILNAIGLGHFGQTTLIALAGAVLAGCVVTPVLLPWIPGRAFSFKGLLVGLVWALIFVGRHWAVPVEAGGWMEPAAYLILLPALSAFYAMNFTGSSTFTSPSGVDKEMRIALPAMLGAAMVGTVLLLVALL